MGRQGCQCVQDVLKKTGQSGGKRKNIFTGGGNTFTKKERKAMFLRSRGEIYQVTVGELLI